MSLLLRAYRFCLPVRLRTMLPASSRQIVNRWLTRNQVLVKADQAAPYERYFSKNKDKRETVDDWRAVLDMAGESAPAPVYARLSQALRIQGDLNAADTVTRQGIARHPDDPTLAQEFAKLAMAQKDWPTAVERWKVLLSNVSSPPCASVYIGMSQVLRSQRDFNAAHIIVRRGLSTHPHDTNLAKELTKLELISPRILRAQQLETSLSGNTGPSTGDEPWQTFLDEYGDSSLASTYLALSRTYRRIGDIATVDAIIREATLIHPDNAALMEEAAEITKTPLRQPRTGEQSTPSYVLGSEDSFIKSNKLRRNDQFIQTCAFGMQFSHDAAQKEVQWLNDCRLSWIEGGGEDAWLVLNEHDQLEFIETLLEEVIQNVVERIDTRRPLTMGVSSGYDSRTILCFLRRAGITPQTFTFGQVGNLDFDFMSILSKDEALETHLFDTSKIEWNLDVLDQHAPFTQDFPLSPRTPVGAMMDEIAPDRYEVSGWFGALTNGPPKHLLEATWDERVEGICISSDRFNFQSLLPKDQILSFLPQKPFFDRKQISYYEQLGLGYFESQRLRPVDGIRVEFIFPFREPKWVGFWLNRTLEETVGQTVWLRFLHSLGASEYRELENTSGRTRSESRQDMTRFLYGTGDSKALIDLTAIKKVLPTQRSTHFCMFACFANNIHFRRMVDKSVGRLKRREIFQEVFIDKVTRRFEAQESNADKMLNGLIAIDVMSEAEMFD